MELEREFWQAMRDKDVDAALRLTDDPCIITGAQGVSRIDKRTFGKIMSGGNWTLEDFALSDVEVLKLSDDVAVIGYKVHEDLTVDGKPLTLDAADASTWVRRDGGWVCAMHTESILGDPYGRDRNPAKAAA
jgi:hypothetical protein